MYIRWRIIRHAYGNPAHASRGKTPQSAVYNDHNDISKSTRPYGAHRHAPATLTSAKRIALAVHGGR